MEHDAVVVTLLGEEHEVVYRDGIGFGIERHDHWSEVSRDRGGVGRCRINGHRWS